MRIYLVNVLEYDLINSFHVHGNFFNWYPTGTSKKPVEFTDTVMLCQGQRGILEICFKQPGKFMFHAHQSEFTELGWMGFFEVDPDGPSSRRAAVQGRLMEAGSPPLDSSLAQRACRPGCSAWLPLLLIVACDRAPSRARRARDHQAPRPASGGDRRRADRARSRAASS